MSSVVRAAPMPRKARLVNRAAGVARQRARGVTGSPSGVRSVLLQTSGQGTQRRPEGEKWRDQATMSCDDQG
jgi:hypothetical protein